MIGRVYTKEMGKCYKLGIFSFFFFFFLRAGVPAYSGLTMVVMS